LRTSKKRLHLHLKRNFVKQRIKNKLRKRIPKMQGNFNDHDSSPVDELAKQLINLLKDERILLELRNTYGHDLLSSSQVMAWRLGRRIRTPGQPALRGMPDNLIAGAALGMKLAGNQSGPETPMMRSHAGPLLDKLLDYHRDALMTSWIFGRRAWHVLTLDSTPTHQDNRLGGKVTRFWEGVQMLPETLLPDGAFPESWLVHSSLLAGGPAGDANILGGGRVLSPRLSGSDGRVDFVCRIQMSQPPIDVGYTYRTGGPYRTQAQEDFAFESFSGLNGLVVERSSVIVSLPSGLFESARTELPGFRFATLPNLLPRDYIAKIIHAIVRHTKGAKRDMFDTWGREQPAVLVKSRDSLNALLSTEGSICPRDLNDTLDEAFHGDRRVYRLQFLYPNPLSFQSVLWPLPWASSEVDSSQKTQKEKLRWDGIFEIHPDKEESLY
jgi:hypothetical protein